MSSDRNRTGRSKRLAAFLALCAAAAWIITDTIKGIGIFFSEHRGIEFYRERPHLIGICIVVALVAGLCVKVILKRRGRRKGSEKNDTVV